MESTVQQPNPKKKAELSVYFLAAPEDEAQCVAVKKYLSPVIRNSKIPIEIHSDFDIPPGQDVNEYKMKLYEADLVLAFISSDFIDDDQTYIRTQKVIERYNNDETVMLPILVRNCMWKLTPFTNLPLLPKNSQPLNNKQFWNSEDDALTSVVTDIYEAINQFEYEEVAAEPAPPEVKEEVEEKPTPEELEQKAEDLVGQIQDIAESKKVEEVADEVTPEVVEEAAEEIAEEVTDTVEEVAEEKPPVVEETPPIVEEVPAPVAEPVKKDIKIKTKPHKSMAVDWRKKYYQRVLWKRTVAFVLDQFLTFAPLFLIGLLIGIMIFDIDVESPELGFGEFAITFFPFIFYAAVCGLVESSKFKGTFGKLIMKMEITDRAGNRIGFFRAFFRNILRFITGYLMILGAVGAIFFLLAVAGGADTIGSDFWMLLGLIPIIIQVITYRKYKKLFHDQISYTVVGERLKQD